MSIRLSALLLGFVACRSAAPVAPGGSSKACPSVDVNELVAKLDQEAERSGAEAAALSPRPQAQVIERVHGIFGTAIRTRDAAAARLYAELAQRELESAFGPGHGKVRELMSQFRVEERRCQEEGVCGVFPDLGVLPIVEAADLKFEDAERAALQGRVVDANRLAEAAATDGEALLRELPLERGQLGYRLGMLYLNELEEPDLASRAFTRAAGTIDGLSSIRTLYADEARLRARVEIGAVRAAMAIAPARSAAIAKQAAGRLSGDLAGSGTDASAALARDFIQHAASGCPVRPLAVARAAGPLDKVIQQGLWLLRRATCSGEPLHGEVDALLNSYAESLALPRQSYDVAGWDAAGSLLRNAVLSLALASRASASQAFDAVVLSDLNGPTRLLTLPMTEGGPSAEARTRTSCLYGELAGRALRDLDTSRRLTQPTTNLWSYAAQVEKRLDAGIGSALASLTPPFEATVRAGLPRDSGFAELTAFQRYSLAEGDAGAPWGPVEYAAFVITADSPIGLVSITPSASAVDERIRQLRADIQRGGSSSLPSLSRAVFDAVLAPVVRSSTVKRWYLVPAGAIELVPFMALHDGHDFLVKRGLQVVTLVSPFDILSKKTKVARSGELKVLAAPSYGSGRHGGSRDPLCPIPRRDLSQLEETRQEAAAVAALWSGKVESLNGDAASVAALAGGPTPAVLHIASHGLLGGNSETKAPSTQSTLWQRQRSAGFASLFCSRIALAGANESNRPPGDDGWLSALEARFLPIDGTQLVVLSACETGASAGSIGEGSFGLKSAFLAAGARSVVSSLWPVESDGTALFMASFYRHLVGGAAKADALYAAARELADGRKHPGFSTPSIWAAFGITGEAGPLVR